MLFYGCRLANTVERGNNNIGGGIKITMYRLPLHGAEMKKKNVENFVQQKFFKEKILNLP